MSEQQKPLIVGNWKMHGQCEDGVALVTAIVAQPVEQVDMVLCPPFTLLGLVAEAVKASRIEAGGQDCAVEEKGAHTGDISAAMIEDVGGAYVIVGHSERRKDHGETSALVNKKAVAAHKAGLKTIICVGELLEEREAGKTMEIVTEQILESVPQGATNENTVIAYEPVWAIGTGKVATTEQIEEVHSAIIEIIAQHFKGFTAPVQVLYGGSVKADNARGILMLPSVGGVLVGGASLNAEEFIQIAQSAIQEKLTIH